MLLEVNTQKGVGDANSRLASGRKVLRRRQSGEEEDLGLFRGALLWDESFLWGLFCREALKKLHFPFTVVLAEEVARGALGSFDLVVVPGGWASQKHRALKDAGRAAMEAFVAAGGGYLGFCGGAGLALDVEDGLGLAAAKRKPVDERLPNFSGGIELLPGSPNLSMWEGVPSPCEVKVWWPSQFEIADEGKIEVLARYGAQGPDFFASDVEVSTLKEKGRSFGELEAEYGINLDPKRIEGEPAVLSARHGLGEAVLSYPHLDTPGEGLWPVMLFNLWQQLGRRARSARKAHDYTAKEEAHPPETAAMLLARNLFGRVRTLIELGEVRGLWRFRNPWLMVWQRGVRGFEFNTLYVLLRELAALLQAKSAASTFEGLSAVEKRLNPFFEMAAPVVSAGSDEGWEELFDPFPGHDSEFTDTLRELDRVIFALVRAQP